jgi:hypothetical protein
MVLCMMRDQSGYSTLYGESQSGYCTLYGDSQSGYCTRMMRAQAGYGGTLYDENAVLL